MRRQILMIITIFISAVFIFLLCGKNFIYAFFPDDMTVYENSESNTDRTINLAVGDSVIFGTYQRVPIEWTVLDIKNDGRVLLQSKKILCFRPFNKGDTNPLGSSDWKTSSLREWLNSNSDDGFFRDENFSAFEKELIWNNQDSIFLLSKGQIQKYCSSDSRAKKPTKAAVVNSNLRFYILPMQNVWYWTSSKTDSNESGVCTVTSSGNFYKSLALDNATGVCPAVYLKTYEFTGIPGEGNTENPYRIGENLH